MSANRIHERAYHDALKRDPERFRRECTFIGTQDDGDGGRLALYNCRCTDTLVIPVDGDVAALEAAERDYSVVAREVEELCLAYARAAAHQLRARTEGESMFVDLSLRGLIRDLLRSAWRKVSRNARVRADACGGINTALHEYRNALDQMRAKLMTIGDTLATIAIMVRDGERGAEFNDACERAVALVTELQGATGEAGVVIGEIRHLVMLVTETF